MADDMGLPRGFHWRFDRAWFRWELWVQQEYGRACHMAGWIAMSGQGPEWERMAKAQLILKLVGVGA